MIPNVCVNSPPSSGGDMLKHQKNKNEINEPKIFFPATSNLVDYDNNISEMEPKFEKEYKQQKTNSLTIHTERDISPKINVPEKKKSSLTLNKSTNVHNFHISPGLRRRNELNINTTEYYKRNQSTSNNLNVAGIHFLRRISSVIRGSSININKDDENLGSLILEDVDEMLNFEVGRNFKYYFPENNPEAILESLKVRKMTPKLRETRSKRKRKMKNERNQSYVRIKNGRDRSFLATFMRKVVSHPTHQNEQNEEEEEKKNNKNN